MFVAVMSQDNNTHVASGDFDQKTGVVTVSYWPNGAAKKDLLVHLRPALNSHKIISSGRISDCNRSHDSLKIEAS